MSKPSYAVSPDIHLGQGAVFDQGNVFPVQCTLEQIVQECEYPSRSVQAAMAATAFYEMNAVVDRYRPLRVVTPQDVRALVEGSLLLVAMKPTEAEPSQEAVSYRIVHIHDRDPNEINEEVAKFRAEADKSGAWVQVRKIAGTRFSGSGEVETYNLTSK